MKRAAKIFAWTALIYGLPPMLVSMTWLFMGGWQMVMFLGCTALPPLPLILTQDSTAWRKPPPIATLAVAVVSLLVSTLLYQRFFRFRIDFFWPY